MNALVQERGGYVTREEFHDMKDDVQKLKSEVALVKSEQNSIRDVSASLRIMLEQIIKNQTDSDARTAAKLDQIMSVKHWVGWVITIATTTGVLSAIYNLVRAFS